MKHRLFRYGFEDKFFIDDTFVESVPIGMHAEVTTTIIAKRELSVKEFRKYFFSKNNLIFTGVHCFAYKEHVVNFSTNNIYTCGYWLLIEEKHLLDILDNIALKWGSSVVKGKDAIFLQNLLNSYDPRQ